MIYLIHISPKYKHAGHYLGFTTSLPSRLATHKSGAGAKLLGAAHKAGCRLRVVRRWIGRGVDRNFERQLKVSHHLRDLCPVCSGRAALARGQFKNLR